MVVVCVDYGPCAVYINVVQVFYNVFLCWKAAARGEGEEGKGGC